MPVSTATKISQYIDLHSYSDDVSTDIGKRRSCLISYSQAEPGRELTQPSPHLLAEPCRWLFSKHLLLVKSVKVTLHAKQTLPPGIERSSQDRIVTTGS